MSTALAVYDRINDPISAVKQLGMSIAKSGMFGCQSVEQGEVFALECMVRKTPPLMLAEQYHVIFGKLSMKSDAMLAKFNELGGSHRIISRTPDLATIELSFGGETVSFSLSWAEASKEPFPYDGKEAAIIEKLSNGQAPPLKAKYATPRSRAQMLWARVVSDAVRAMCPQVNNGRYTPEELDGDDEPVKQTRAKKAEVADVPPVVETATGKPVADGEVIDGEFTVAKPEPATKKEPLPAGTTEPQWAATGQLLQIDELLDKLSATPEQREKMMHKRKVNSFRLLTISQAEELIHALAVALNQKKLTAKAAENQPVVQIEPARRVLTGPSTAEQVTEAKRVLTELKQTNQKLYDGFIQKVLSSGRKMLKDLSANDCDRLITAVKDTKLADDFFKASLENWKSNGHADPHEKDDAEVAEAVAERKSAEPAPF